MDAAIRVGSSVKLMQRCLILFFHTYFRFLHLLFFAEVTVVHVLIC